MNTQPEYSTDMPVGEILRQAREHYGQSLEDVEKNLRIRAVQLYAVEQGDDEKLPGRVYAIGFVRSYSEYLGFDPDRMVELYKRQSAGKKTDPKLDFPVAASDSRLPGPVLMGISVVVLLGLLIGYFGMSGDDVTKKVNEIPAVEDVMGSQKQAAIGSRVISDEPLGPPAPAEISAEESVKQKGIILNVVENSWVQIQDASGKKLVSQVLKEGDQYFVPDRPDLTMSIGNAAGVEIVVSGMKIPPLGPRGQVRRNISLDMKALKALAQDSQ